MKPPWFYSFKSSARYVWSCEATAAAAAALLQPALTDTSYLAVFLEFSDSVISFGEAPTD